jgi:peptidoglycan hydrolase CwlO-like protein
VNALQSKLSSLSGTETSLTSEIAYLDTQISLTSAKIQNTQNQIQTTQQQIDSLATDISSLTQLISKLEDSIAYQQTVLDARLRERYKSYDNNPLIVLLDSTSLNQMVQKTEYLEMMEIEDTKLITEMNDNKAKCNDQKTIFQGKKNEQEQLKAQLVAEKASLDSYIAQLADQQQAKKKLLEVTQDSEVKYQQMLAQAQAESEAIQGILNGGGVETSGSPVKVGQKIATIIQGSSCNSGGTHLHFMVYKGNTTVNPFNYLKKGVPYVNCSGSYCGSGDGDSFNPHGSWPWPITGTVQLNQGYGVTWAVRNRITWYPGGIHNGIDILGDNLNVYATESGTYIRGTFTGNNGCTLRYVKVVDSSGLEVFYLHVNY